MRVLLEVWRKLRSRYWLSLGFDLALLILVLWAIHAWQTRELPLGEPAPHSVLSLLGRGDFGRVVQPGEVGVVYFFAPWCGICRNSIGNLDELVQSGKVSWASAVALDYSNEAEVKEFVSSTDINLPVFMGSQVTASEWAIRGFPTYFVIDSGGNIDSRSVGYSTKMGLWMRVWMAE
jgi:thiol-disulfide isomerase/thioredoxin